MSATQVVLLGEDEASIRTLITRVLEKHGYRIILAADGREAVSLFRDHMDEVDIVILDVRMPNLAGPEALVEIRALRPSIPAILMSGFTADHDLAALLQSGVRFVPKPLRLNELADVVSELLAGSTS